MTRRQLLMTVAALGFAPRATFASGPPSVARLTRAEGLDATPCFVIENEMIDVTSAWSAWREWRPTGRQFFTIDGRAVSEPAFYTTMATVRDPRWRDMAQAWRATKAKG